MGKRIHGSSTRRHRICTVSQSGINDRNVR
ncbi:Uncharacterised protein [Vibrio cholerae]|nr:Uncharacterised protein [Vibrio cholerae]CSI92351.1 Uncharacterised protein [Vibrio cholerae]